jgi:hypothetical protein
MVKRSRIRRKGKELDREVIIPAYESMRTNESLGSPVGGYELRNYKKVFPQVFQTRWGFPSRA